MANDINDLDLEQEAGVAGSQYEKPSKFFRPVEAGEQLLIRDSDPSRLSFGMTKAKDLMASVRFMLVDNPKVGFFDRVFTSVSKFRSSTSADDFVRATGGVVGDGETRPTLRDYKEAIEQSYGPFSAIVGWEAYCETCGVTTIKKTADFPMLEDGRRNHLAQCPVCEEEIGAKAKVVRYIIK